MRSMVEGAVAGTLCLMFAPSGRAGARPPPPSAGEKEGRAVHPSRPGFAGHLRMTGVIIYGSSISARRSFAGR
jgi:hypothetical protein